jgi:hypothetical protein
MSEQFKEPSGKSTKSRREATNSQSINQPINHSIDCHIELALIILRRWVRINKSLDKYIMYI